MIRHYGPNLLTNPPTPLPGQNGDITMHHTPDEIRDRFSFRDDVPEDVRDFFQQYVATALWASTDDNGEPLDAYRPEDIAPESLRSMLADCQDFLTDDVRDMVPADRMSDAGHDFWLTRNGHGAGFWDGDWAEHGDTLTELADAYRGGDLYVATSPATGLDTVYVYP